MLSGCGLGESYVHMVTLRSFFCSFDFEVKYYLIHSSQNTEVYSVFLCLHAHSLFSRGAPIDWTDHYQPIIASNVSIGELSICKSQKPIAF